MQGLRAWARERKRQREAGWRTRHASATGGDWPHRLVYLSPDENKPTGGIKVLYRHVEALRELGVDAHVMHIAEGFRCSWFDSSAPVLHFGQLRPGDEVVLPETMSQFAERLRARGVPYTMFVQNGYLALEVCAYEATRAAYAGARAVLAISDDTLELLRAMMPGLKVPLLRVQHSVDAARFAAGDTAAQPPQPPHLPLVTWMPRKMPQHARLVTGWLAAAHPEWRFMALDGLSEAEVATALRGSRLFLAFSEYEGLPLPPIEAALAGNRVLGYPGWGALEYWSPPLFHAVPYGDVRAFVAGFAALAPAAAAPPPPEVLAARDTLAQRFGAAAERTLLQAAATRLGWLPEQPALHRALSPAG